MSNDTKTVRQGYGTQSGTTLKSMSANGGHSLRQPCRSQILTVHECGVWQGFKSGEKLEFIESSDLSVPLEHKTDVGNLFSLILRQLSVSVQIPVCDTEGFHGGIIEPDHVIWDITRPDGHKIRSDLIAAVADPHLVKIRSGSLQTVLRQ